MSLKEMIQQKEALADQIEAIQAAVRPQIDPLKVQLQELEKQIDEASVQAATEVYRQAKMDTGNREFVHEGVRVKAVIGKTVEWDQQMLARIRERILSAGDDPGQYIQEKLGVSEKAFTAWPDPIKAVFLPARTVRPGRPKFEYLVLDPDAPPVEPPPTDDKVPF